MHNKRGIYNLMLVILLLSLSQLLGACQAKPTTSSLSSSTKHSEESHNDHEGDNGELAERIIVDFDGSVALYQTSDFSDVATFKSGIWEEDHGDHSHFHEEPPLSCPTRLLAGNRHISSQTKI